MFDKNLCCEDSCQREALTLKHLEAVLAHNKKVNLTSITERAAGEVLHIEDSLAVLPALLKAPAGPYLDLGSGAGYPGIPLALYSGRPTTLLESLGKKAAFLQSFIENNGLARQIQVAAVRSEELALTQGPIYAVVTARAVAELPVLLELVAPLLVMGGHFIAMKGKPDATEVKRAKRVGGMTGMHLRTSYSYRLSDGASERMVLIYEKVGEPSVCLPRRPGIAKKRPFA